MIEFRVEMDAPSAPNLREHPMVRAKRVKKQRAAVARKMPKWTEGPMLVVRLTRVAPRELDDDNLQGAMKAVRDQVAAGLRVDDASPLVRWEYAQAKGPAEVLVQVDALHARPTVGAAMMAEMMLPPGEGNYERAMRRALRPAIEACTCPDGACAGPCNNPSAARKKRAPSSAYQPPRAKPVGAVSMAQETFAPCCCVGTKHEDGCIRSGHL